MDVRDQLLEVLNDLDNNEFSEFKWYLCGTVLDNYKPIAKSLLEDAKRWDTVSNIIKSYGNETAVAITVKILKKMNQNGAAQALEKKFPGSEEGTAASSTTSSSAAAPPGQTITATHGSTVIVPNFSNTEGACTITFQKSS